MAPGLVSGRTDRCGTEIRVVGLHGILAAAPLRLMPVQAADRLITMCATPLFSESPCRGDISERDPNERDVMPGVSGGRRSRERDTGPGTSMEPLGGRGLTTRTSMYRERAPGDCPSCHGRCLRGSAMPPGNSGAACGSLPPGDVVSAAPQFRSRLMFLRPRAAGSVPATARASRTDSGRGGRCPGRPDRGELSPSPGPSRGVAGPSRGTPRRGPPTGAAPSGPGRAERGPAPGPPTR